MPISAEHVGRRYALPEPFEVTAERVAAFSAAVGEPADVVAPTFLATLAARAWEPFFADADLDVALARVVHADQSFRFTRPVEIGDRLAAALVITRVRARGPVETISISVEVDDAALDDAARRRVCTADSTFLHTREVAA